MNSSIKHKKQKTNTNTRSLTIVTIGLKHFKPIEAQAALSMDV